MTELEARTRLEDLLQWDAAPALTVAEVDRLLVRARITDENYVAVDDVGYVDTWDEASISLAVSEGFDMKAAKVIGQYDLKAADVQLWRSQQAVALRAAARRYGGGGMSGIGTITLTTALAEAST